MDYRNKLEVDLIDLAQKVLSKWRILIIFMIVFGILGGAIGYYKSGTMISTESEEVISTTTDTDISSLKAALTQSSANFVEGVYKQYEIEYSEYSDLLEQGNSFLFLNENEIFGFSKSYYISNYSHVPSLSYSDDNIDESVSDINNDTVVKTDVYNNLIITYLNNIFTTYKKELLRDDVINNIADIALVDTGNVQDIIYISLEGDSILTITVYGENEETAVKMMDIITEDFDSITEKVKSVYDFDITYIDSYSYKGEDDYISNIRSNYSQMLNKYRSEIVSLTTNMTTEEKAYYTALINQDTDIEENSVMETYVSDVSNNEQETVVVRSFDKKYMLIGMFIGLFIPMFIIVLMYIMSSKLHTGDDLRSAFGVSVLGELSSDGKNMDVICQGATIGASKLSGNNIYLMGASDDDISVKCRKDISNSIKLCDNLKEVKDGTSAVNDAVSMKELSESDAVVLVERIGYSAYDDIAKEIELCNKFGVKIIGAVIVS